MDDDTLVLMTLKGIADERRQRAASDVCRHG